MDSVKRITIRKKVFKPSQPSSFSSNRQLNGIDRDRDRENSQVGGRNIPLRWSSRECHLSNSFNALYRDVEKAKETMALTDVTLASSDGDLMNGHRLVLSLCSPYFRRLFLKLSEKKKNTNELVVVLGNVKTSELRSLFRFIYRGEATVSADNLKRFLEIGKSFGIQELVSACQRELSAESRRDTREETLSSGVEESHLFHDEGDEDRDDDYFGQNDTNDTNDNFGTVDDANHHTISESDVDAVENEDATSSHGSGRASTSWKCASLEWEIIPEVSDTALQSDWIIRNTRTYGEGENSKIINRYMCAYGGKRCGAMLKQEILSATGQQTFFSNNVPHGKHSHRGLQPEQQKFVFSLLKRGIMRTTQIEEEMNKAGMASPAKKSIMNYVRLFGIENDNGSDNKSPKIRRKTLKQDISHEEEHDTSARIADTFSDSDPDFRPETVVEDDKPARRKSKTKTRVDEKNENYTTNWTIIPPLSPYEMERDWRIKTTKPSAKFRKPGVTVRYYYYCVYGGNSRNRPGCSAQLKVQKLNGISKYYVNNKSHCNHVEEEVLTEGQKNYLHELLLTITKDVESFTSDDYYDIRKAFKRYNKNLGVPSQRNIRKYLMDKYGVSDNLFKNDIVEESITQSGISNENESATGTGHDKSQDGLRSQPQESGTVSEPNGMAD